MLDKLFLSLFLIGITFYGNSQTWYELGSPNFSSGINNEYQNIVLDNNGTPYVTFEDGNSISVMKYDGQNWVSVGLPQFYTNSKLPKLAISSNGTAYVAFQDLITNNGKASVLKFDGSNWVAVGSLGFTPGEIDNIDIGFDSEDSLYVTYEYYHGINDPNVVGVSKFSNNGWVQVEAIFDALRPNLAFAPWGVVYLTYTYDSGGTPHQYIKKYFGGTWSQLIFSSSTNSNHLELEYFNDKLFLLEGTTVGNSLLHRMDSDGDNSSHLISYSSGYPNTIGRNARMAFDSEGTPYAVFRDNQNKTSVYKYIDFNWNEVGNIGFSVENTYHQDIAIDSNDNLYVVYQEWENGNTTAMKLCNVSDNVTQNENILTVDVTGLEYQWFSNCGTTNDLLTNEVNESFEALNNGVYGVEITNGSCSVTSDCFTIDIIGIKEEKESKSLDIYPNPNNGNFTIKNASIDAELTIQTIDGKIIHNEKVLNNEYQKITTNLNPGVYLIQIAKGDEIYTQKMIIE